MAKTVAQLLSNKLMRIKTLKKKFKTRSSHKLSVKKTFTALSTIKFTLNRKYKMAWCE